MDKSTFLSYFFYCWYNSYISLNKNWWVVYANFFCYAFKLLSTRLETEGLTLRFYKAAEDAYRKPEHVPFTLNPIPITKKCFEKISDNQLIINKLIHLASMDQKFLQDSFQTILPNDEFWRKLFQVYTESQKHRSDSIINLYINFMYEKWNLKLLKAWICK